MLNTLSSVKQLACEIPQGIKICIKYNLHSRSFSYFRVSKHTGYLTELLDDDCKFIRKIISGKIAEQISTYAFAKDKKMVEAYEYSYIKDISFYGIVYETSNQAQNICIYDVEILSQFKNTLNVWQNNISRLNVLELYHLISVFNPQIIMFYGKPTPLNVISVKSAMLLGLIPSIFSKNQYIENFIFWHEYTNKSRRHIYINTIEKLRISLVLDKDLHSDGIKILDSCVKDIANITEWYEGLNATADVNLSFLNLFIDHVKEIYHSNDTYSLLVHCVVHEFYNYCILNDIPINFGESFKTQFIKHRDKIKNSLAAKLNFLMAYDNRNAISAVNRIKVAENENTQLAISGEVSI